jgi:hypothetical protein
MVEQKLKDRAKYLVTFGSKKDAKVCLQALRALRILKPMVAAARTVMGEWIDIDRTAALDNVDQSTAKELAKVLDSADLVGRLLIAMPMDSPDPKGLGQTLQEALQDPQFQALSTHMKEPMPFTAWVRGFSALWEEKLQQAGLSPTAGQLSEVLLQILPAMLEA